MKKLLIVPMVAVTMLGFVPNEAQGSQPVVAVCQGTGGYDANGTWNMREDQGIPGIASNCVNTVSDPRDPTTCPPTLPPTDPFGIFGWLDCPAETLPVANPFTNQTLRLSAEGDFACGSGTLSSSGDNSFRWIDGMQGSERWDLDWTGTFSEGIAQITGSATNADTGETRDLGGTIVIEDGATAGACDDSAGSQLVVVRLVLS